MKKVKKLAATGMLLFLVTSPVVAADNDVNSETELLDTVVETEIAESAFDLQFKVFNPSPGYFSVYLAHFKLSYENQDIPWGSRVYLHYNGLDFKPAPQFPRDFEWYLTKTTEMKAVAPYTWAFDSIDPSIKNSPDVWLERGMSRPKSLLKFDIKIVLPDGQVIWDKGSDSELGYYMADTEVTDGCSIFSNFCTLRVEAIKWDGKAKD